MKSILFGVFLCFYSTINSQFIFDSYFEDYLPIENPQLLTFDVWDDPILYIPIGFEFNLFGQNISSLYSYNGYHNELYSEVLEDSTVHVLIPLFADLIDAGSDNNQSESTISYTVIGEAPYRKCIIQWENCAFYSEGDISSSYNDRVNFQVWLFETTNTIEYHYGEMTINNLQIDFDTDGIYIGMIESLSITQEMQSIENEWHVISDNPSTSLINVFSFANEIYTIPLLSEAPQSGSVYRFSTLEMTSVEDNLLAQSADVFPTVFSHYFTIKSNYKASYNIYNIEGKKLDTGLLTLGENTIITDELKAGLYFLEIIGRETKKTFKLVKK